MVTKDGPDGWTGQGMYNVIRVTSEQKVTNVD